MRRDKENSPNITVPSVHLPKGGAGAHKISEKFEPDLLTGGSQYQYTLDITQARALTPNLTLNYSSNYGDGVFGQGFSLNAGDIKRKTSHRVPTYDDDQDVFIYGGHDLVCVTEEQSSSNGLKYKDYRQRVVQSFAVIRHYYGNNKKNKKDENFWKVYETDGANYYYGYDYEQGQDTFSRIANPKLTSDIFSWHLSQVEDAKGNRAQYQYKEGSPCYLERIVYGNYWHEGQKDQELFAFQLEFSYKVGAPRRHPVLSFRSGFEIRHDRLCDRILLSHHLHHLFKVKQWSFQYGGPCKTQPVSLVGKVFLRSIQLTGFRHTDPSLSMPKVQFEYEPFILEQKISADAKLQEITLGQLKQYQFVDLYREGLPGLLYSDGVSAFFRRNKGSGRFAAAQRLIELPRQSNLQSPQCRILDLEGNHQLKWVVSSESRLGYYPLNKDGHFERYYPVEQYPYEYHDPMAEFLDLEGNGLVDILTWVSPPRFYLSDRLKGYQPAQELILRSSPTFPVGTLHGDQQWVGFVNMFGDGLSHRVVIKADSVTCWLNLGHGKFGQPISFKSPPRFTHFHRAQLFVNDITGTGGVDLIYVKRKEIDIYFNQGDSFSKAYTMTLPMAYSSTDNLHFVDLLGQGSSCLVFAKNGYHPTQYYYDFSRGKRPFLLTQIKNGLGATTKIEYSNSVQTYLQDLKSDIAVQHTLPFSNPIVSKVTVTDDVTGDSYENRYAFHDGYYDPIEREFNGFAFVEHWDSEKNQQTATAYTKLWFHVGSKTVKPSCGFKQCKYKQDQAGIYYNLYETYRKQSSPLHKNHYWPAEIKGKMDIYESRLYLPKMEKSPADNDSIFDQACFALKGQLLRKEIYGEKDAPFSVDTFGYDVSQYSEAKSLPEQKRTHCQVFSIQPNESVSYQFEEKHSDSKIVQDIVIERNRHNLVIKQKKIYHGRPGFDITKELVGFDIEKSVRNKVPSGKKIAILYETRYFNNEDVFKKDNFLFLDVPVQIQKKDISNGEEELLELEKYYYYHLNPSGEPQKKWMRLGKVDKVPLLHHIKTAVLDEKKTRKIYQNGFKEKTVKKHFGYFKIGEVYYFPSLAQRYHGKDKYYLPKKVFSNSGRKNNPLYSCAKIKYDHFSLKANKLIKVRYKNKNEKLMYVKSKVSVEYDPYNFNPTKITDENCNVRLAKYDSLGQLRCTTRFNPKFRAREEQERKYLNKKLSDFNFENLKDFLVGDQTVYYGFYGNENGPNWILTVNAENYREGFSGDMKREGEIYCQIDYIDGLGRAIQTRKIFSREKMKWLVSGHIQYNRKGLPIIKYLPYFEDHGYEFKKCSDAKLSKSKPFKKAEYDAMNRRIKITHADNKFHQTKITPWWVLKKDENFNADVTGQPGNVTLEINGTTLSNRCIL